MWSGNGPALEIAGITLGLREGVIGLIAFVALYMLLVLLRMRRLRRKHAATLTPERPAAPVEPSAQPAAVASPAPVAEPVRQSAWGEPPAMPAQDALRRGLEQELLELRDEVDAMRGELAALRQDMRQELAHLRAAQTVSPIYGDAMQMAAAGYEPAAIAERCGIARAEAELVVSLAKSRNS